MCWASTQNPSDTRLTIDATQAPGLIPGSTIAKTGTFSAVELPRIGGVGRLKNGEIPNTTGLRIPTATTPQRPVAGTNPFASAAAVRSNPFLTTKIGG